MYRPSRHWIVLSFLLAWLNVAASSAQEPKKFDPEAATRAYLDRIPDEERERSDAYFEGGYWLQLVGYLYGLGVAWILLAGRISARMRDWAERWRGRGVMGTALYAVQYIVVSFVFGFPLTIYQGYFREHQYGHAGYQCLRRAGCGLREDTYARTSHPPLAYIPVHRKLADPPGRARQRLLPFGRSPRDPSLSRSKRRATGLRLSSARLRWTPVSVWTRPRMRSSSLLPSSSKIAAATFFRSSFRSVLGAEPSKLSRVEPEAASFWTFGRFHLTLDAEEMPQRDLGLARGIVAFFVVVDTDAGTSW